MKRDSTTFAKFRDDIIGDMVLFNSDFYTPIPGGTQGWILDLIIFSTL